MIVQEISSGEDKPAYIEVADSKDFRLLTKRRYSFNRSVYTHTADTFVLRLEMDNDILGVMELRKEKGRAFVAPALVNGSSDPHYSNDSFKLGIPISSCGVEGL